MNPVKDSETERLYRKLKNMLRYTADSEKTLVAWLKGAKYAFYIFLMITASGIVFYFISGEFLDPSRVIGTGAWADTPASDTYFKIVASLATATVCWVVWKVILPWRRGILAEEERKADEDRKTLDEIFYGGE